MKHEQILPIFRFDFGQNLTKFDMKGCFVDLSVNEIFEALRAALRRLTMLQRFDISDTKLSGKLQGLFRDCDFRLTYFGASHCRMDSQDVDGIKKFKCFQKLQEIRIARQQVVQRISPPR